MFRPRISSLKIGTRGSDLALYQARLIAEKIRKKFPRLSISEVVIRTSGDKYSNIKNVRKLSCLGHEFAGKGLFVKEIEEALLSGKIDIAVHSLKDVPASLPHGLVLAAFAERASPNDLFVSYKFRCLADLPRNSIVGTSSPRRAAQLLAKRPDILIRPIRGNVGTRLAKLERGEFCAAIFAEAGLSRLGLLKRAKFYAEPLDWMVPAMGQGIICCETRSSDIATCEILQASVNCASTERCALAERAFLNEVGGDCHTPLGAQATELGDKIHLRVSAISPDGKEVVRGSAKGIDPVWLGRMVGRKLVAKGARGVIGLGNVKRPAMIATHTALSRSLEMKLKRKCANLISLPALKVLPPSDSFCSLDRALGELEKFDWLVFTSRHGVEGFCRRFFALGFSDVKLPKIAAVGPSTAEVLRSMGLKVDLVPQGETSTKGIERSFEKLKRRPKNILIVGAEGSEHKVAGRFVAGYKTIPSKIPSSYLKDLFATENVKFICHGSAKGELSFEKMLRRARTA